MSSQFFIPYINEKWKNCEKHEHVGLIQQKEHSIRQTWYNSSEIKDVKCRQKYHYCQRVAKQLCQNCEEFVVFSGVVDVNFVSVFRRVACRDILTDAGYVVAFSAA